MMFDNDRVGGQKDLNVSPKFKQKDTKRERIKIEITSGNHWLG